MERLMPLENGWTFVFVPVAAAKLLAHATRYVSHLMAQVLHFESSWIPHRIVLGSCDVTDLFATLVLSPTCDPTSLKKCIFSDLWHDTFGV